jgi:hypothetical protein
MELASLSVKALRTLASAQKIKGRSTLKKEGLITALSASKNTTLKNKKNKPMEVETVKETVCPIVSESTSVNKNHVRELFFSKCDDKGKNDKYNKLREEILANILEDTYKSFKDDEEEGRFWILLQNQWKEVLDKISKKEHDTIQIKQKGGRGYNYDFDIMYKKDNKVLETIKVEFKCGARGTTIDEIPQFFNADANKKFLLGYAEWFYDNYITKKEIFIKFDPPSKEKYLKEIYKNVSKLEFFNKLKNEEKDKEFYKLKQKETVNSITQWLEENYKKLDLEELTKEFIRSQENKVFLLWNKDTFAIDKFEKDELEVITIVGLNKQKNSIIVNSKKIQYSMLLRWKNHLGVLKPAWQISMKRLVK